MIQRTPLFTLFCATLIGLAGCGAPGASSLAPTASAQSDGERSTQSVTPVIAVTQRLQLLNVTRGQNAAFACAIQVAVTSPTYPFTVTGWGSGTAIGGGGTFPVWNYPRTSAVTWSVEGAGTAARPVANSGSPGDTVFTGTASPAAQTHCIDISLSIPATQPTGSYTAAIQYTVLERVGFIGLAVTHQTATFTVAVGGN